MVNDQFGLFAPSTTDTPAPARPSLPPRPRKRTRSMVNPGVAQDVLAEVQDGRYGLLDDSDRVVLFEDTDRVRIATDEDAVHALLAGRYVERCPARDTVSCLHGAIRRPVSPLRLTRQGRNLLSRWSALKPY
ncbi:hypothetical protein GCM10027445_12140 [Amycolatopsis endophytica]|uniref:Uncharacterized protein n=1 Tax=Amycolatopsis endophytica TaxID=860233 RepID=A0A853B3K4_9PSEU|nr:hypothetical protein [Amycolatopsis endophytica]NYI89351.1 hypothetical protein [Amycolatopsis endophytica]